MLNSSDSIIRRLEYGGTFKMPSSTEPLPFPMDAFVCISLHLQTICQLDEGILHLPATCEVEIVEPPDVAAVYPPIPLGSSICLPEQFLHGIVRQEANFLSRHRQNVPVWEYNCCCHDADPPPKSVDIFR